MKRMFLTAPSASPLLPQLTEILVLPFSDRNATKQAVVLANAYVGPSDEMISYLNRIGQEYPFCVYYKEKANDPL
jgi:hypothetical protein